MKGHRLRLSGGTLGGRTVHVPVGVRPTGARVREALMDIWAAHLPGARFLDLFAGSGAVGLEAVSRGAASALLVEGSSRVARGIRKALAELEPEGVRLVEGRLPGALGGDAVTRAAPFDLAFADPPYSFASWESLLPAVAPLLAASGRLALEHEARQRPPDRVEGLELEDRRRYGESALTFYRVVG